jgi:neutral ceramidase
MKNTPLTLFTFWFCASLAVAASGRGQAAAAAARVFKAGAAASNITPPLGTDLIGGWAPRPATHIHDELHARCLVLDDGTNRLVFVIVDNVSVIREVYDEAKRLIHEATGIPPERMMMAATHTHSAPSARGPDAMAFDNPLDEYQHFLVRRIVDGVRRAINNLEPARIGWGVGEVPQHVVSRRWLIKDGGTVVNPFGGQDRVVRPGGSNLPPLQEPAGPVNPEVYFLSVQSTGGRPIALLANYWLHYVGGVGAGHVSADYFGVFAEEIKHQLGADRSDPPFIGIMANGPCGDVISNAPPGRYAPYEKMRLIAENVAREVVRVHRTIRHRDWVELKAAQAELELKMRRPTPEQIQRARQVLARPRTVQAIHSRETVYAERILKARDWPETVSIVMQTFGLGELGIAAIPFEVLTETGLEIKAKSPYQTTFTIELANGGYGYLATPERHELGGYETWLGTNRVEKEASRKIVATLLELFAQTKSNERN